MKSFIITQRNGIEHVVLIDDIDYEQVMKYKWSVTKKRKTFYVQRTKNIYDINGNKKAKNIILHRQLLGLTDPKTPVDHRDHNGLNNQRENIRAVTYQQNQFNKMKASHYKGKPTSSKYKGVYWNKEKKKWRAQISYKCKVKFLGYFTDEYEAHLAYESAAKNYQGDFRYKK